MRLLVAEDPPLLQIKTSGVLLNKEWLLRKYFDFPVTKVDSDVSCCEILLNEDRLETGWYNNKNNKAFSINCLVLPLPWPFAQLRAAGWLLAAVLELETAETGAALRLIGPEECPQWNCRRRRRPDTALHYTDTHTTHTLTTPRLQPATVSSLT